MRINKWISVFLTLVVILYASTSFANETESPAHYNGYWNGMSQNGLLTTNYDLIYDEEGNPYYSSGPFYWFDYETGTALLACSHLECSHATPKSLYDDRPLLEIMNDPSVCYAWRLKEIPITGPVMYKGKMYCYSSFPDVLNETHRVGIYEMEIDGRTRQIASLGHLFSWEQYPECTDYIINNGYVYLNVFVSKNSNLDFERSEVLGDVPCLSIIYQVSLENGQTTELCIDLSQEFTRFLAQMVLGKV